MDYPETFDEYKEYRDASKAELPPPPKAQEQPKIKLNSYESAYADWLRDKSPANMSRLLDTFAPTINSEIMRYEGSKPLLRSKARVLAIKAVKSFNPMSGAKLQSWVVTNLKPLSRYGQQQRDVRIPEVALRQAAEVNRVTSELRDDLGRDPTDEEIADEIGISTKRVAKVREMAVASVPSGQLDEVAGEDGDSSIAPAVVTPSQVPFAQDAVYMSLDNTDKLIFDSLTGSHGRRQVPAKVVAARLGITPAAVSQHANRIAQQISEIANG
jgi:DNA-directed RNA polymerase specialized sigma subunit